MPRFRKKLIEPDFYQSPEGPAAITPERIRHWHSTFQALKANGVRIPLSWAHHKIALPYDKDADTNEGAFHRSRYNAGTITDTEIDADGALWFTGEAPGVEIDANGDLVTDTELPDGRKVKCAIGEVSLGVDNWTDGKGQAWPDALIHVALTPLPVWAGQPGFETATPSTAQHFSLASRLRFATIPTKEPPVADEKEGDVKGDEAEGANAKLGRIAELLEKLDIHLGDKVADWDDLCARLEAAVLTKSGGPDSGATEEPIVPDAGGPMLMSTIRGKADPITLALLDDKIASDKATRKARIAALKKSGVIPLHMLTKLETESTRVEFSLDAKGKAIVPDIDNRIAQLEELLPTLVTLSTKPDNLTSVTPPEGEQQTPSHFADVADQLAQAAGLPARGK